MIIIGDYGNYVNDANMNNANGNYNVDVNDDVDNDNVYVNDDAVNDNALLNDDFNDHDNENYNDDNEKSRLICGPESARKDLLKYLDSRPNTGTKIAKFRTIL